MTTPALAERSIVTVDADLTRHAAELGEKIDLLVQAVTQDVFNHVQAGGPYSPGTPVDTGFARANWQGGIGGVTPTPAISQEAAKEDPAAGRAAAARRQEENARVATEAKAGLVIELANNASYIAALEDGHSRQAPQGMVKQTVLHAQQIVDENAAHILARFR